MGILKKTGRIILKGLFWIFLVTIALLTASAFYNLTLSSSSSVTERLTESQKVYIAEYFNLQDQIMKELWPGVVKTQIPVIVYNEEYAFLVGLEDPEAGWLKVPADLHRGHKWVEMESDNFQGDSYYYQFLPDPDITPENFTVKVGSDWVSTLQTREFAEVSFYNGFKQELPPLISQVFPYKIFWNLVMGEAESYVSAMIHEAFHAHQGMISNSKFSRAEIFARRSNEYPWHMETNRTGWSNEADLLMKAYKSESDADIHRYISEFIDVRETRREEAELTEDMIDYEKHREWLEGLAKYTELKIGMVADDTPGYEPVAEIVKLGDFKNYSKRDSYFQKQLSEVQRAAGRSGESRFYFGGMLQAMILDKVAPDWKKEIFDERVFLEDLLKKTISDS